MTAPSLKLALALALSASLLQPYTAGADVFVADYVPGHSVHDPTSPRADGHLEDPACVFEWSPQMLVDRHGQQLDMLARCEMNVHISGELTPEDAAAFRMITEKLDDWGEYARTHGIDWSIPNLVLDSTGGSVAAALAIGDTIRSSSRWADSGSAYAITCHSSCVIVLGAAYRRLVLGEVAIHRPYFVGAAHLEWSYRQHRQKYDELRAEISRRFDAWNLSASLVSDMFRVPSTRLKVLTPAELDAYGLGQDDMIVAERSHALFRQVCGPRGPLLAQQYERAAARCLVSEADGEAQQCLRQAATAHAGYFQCQQQANELRSRLQSGASAANS